MLGGGNDVETTCKRRKLEREAAQSLSTQTYLYILKPSILAVNDTDHRNTCKIELGPYNLFLDSAFHYKRLPHRLLSDIEHSESLAKPPPLPPPAPTHLLPIAQKT